MGFLNKTAIFNYYKIQTKLDIVEKIATYIRYFINQYICNYVKLFFSLKTNLRFALGANKNRQVDFSPSY